MNSNYYPIYGFGLIIPDYDTAKKIASLNGYSDSDGNNDRLMEFICDHGVLLDEETYNPSTEYLDGTMPDDTTDFVVCLDAKQPDPFKNVYESHDEVADEFRKQFRFPDGFDVKRHIGWFSGVMHG